MGTNPQRSENTNHNVRISLQESIACMVQCPNQIIDQTDVRHGLQTLFLTDEPHSQEIRSNNSGNNPTPMDYEVYSHSLIQGQSISHDGSSSTGLEVGYLRSELCIGGSSFSVPEQFHSGGISSHNASASSPDYRLLLPMGVQLGSNPTAQNHHYQQQDRDTTFTEHTRLHSISQQQNRSSDLLSVLGHVRSPLYADLIVRLDTFSQWPSDIAQTPNKVAEAGFYYTGFQDIVRCFACDGGLKNWDPDDDPWVEHARWFPQCAYVLHIKGEEFINLVRMSTEESDEDDDNTVHRGAAWGGNEDSNTKADSVSNEITEPSVLESKDAQTVIKMGFSEKDVAMAINDIFKKGRHDFTGEEIVDIILEKETLGKQSNSKLSADCPSSVRNMPASEQAMSENKHLKELLQCTECKTKQRNILFLPCTHHVVCESCSDDLHICTCCFRNIKEKVRTYMS
ncbi:hypothetical protein CHS0354_025970 [Potamilus streckersoni]|uniref:Uncharacterized protein n=1 Tax=Potamilus streckersoni TaxID=2493646 RepID=A0AAE0T4T1_9BIVA|nr:hypothetical protein CHS0354_025970 [Potamilus streckersoni]